MSKDTTRLRESSGVADGERADLETVENTQVNVPVVESHKEHID